MAGSSTLFEVHESLNGVHYTQAGWTDERLAFHRDMLAQATRADDGRYYIWVPNELLTSGVM